MGEAAKIRERVLCYLKDKTVLDLGCGDEKIVPWAIGVDSAQEHARLPAAVDIVAPVGPSHAPDLREVLRRLHATELFDVVFSSHTLEHMVEPIKMVLDHWASFVKPGGLLILYLPDERYYVFDREFPRRRNPAHHHFLTFETFPWYLDQVHGLRIDSFAPDFYPPETNYSFLIVARKVGS